MVLRNGMVRLHLLWPFTLGRPRHLSLRSCQTNLPNHRIRTDWTDADGDPDFEAPFYILKHTYCAAVLTENLFMDSHSDLAFLESTEGKKAIVALHVEGIIEFVK